MTTPALSRQDEDDNRWYRNPLTGRDDYRSVTTILGLLPNDFHKIPPAVLERASRRGDFVHKAFEDGTTCRTDIIPPLDIPELAQDLRSACAFLDEWQPHIIHQELTVFNDTLGYAGSLDMIADFGGSIGLVLGDIKTSRDVRSTVPLQLAAYGMAEYALTWKTMRPHDPNDPGEWTRIDMPDIDSYGVIYIRGELHEFIPIAVSDTQFDQFAKLCDMTDFAAEVEAAGRAAIGRPIPPPDKTIFDERVEALRARIGHLDNEAKESLKAEMIDKGISLKTATEHSQIDTASRMIGRADRQLGTTPEWWTEDAISEVMADVAALPPDLEVELVATCKRYGVPHLRTGLVREHHITYLKDRLSYYMDRQDERAGQVANFAGNLLPGSANIYDDLKAIALTASAARRSGAIDDYGMLQELEAQRAITVIEAIGSGVLVIENGAVTPATDAVEQLVAHVGSKKKIVAVGKEVADEQRLPRPKSTADVVGNPALTAGVWKETA